MSGGKVCRHAWALLRPHTGQGEAGRIVVTARRSNHSKFNGSRFTPSRYSEVMCLECRSFWRTKAAYVNRLPDATDDDWASVGVLRAGSEPGPRREG